MRSARRCRGSSISSIDVIHSIFIDFNTSENFGVGSSSQASVGTSARRSFWISATVHIQANVIKSRRNALVAFIKHKLFINTCRRAIQVASKLCVISLVVPSAVSQRMLFAELSCSSLFAVPLHPWQKSSVNTNRPQMVFIFNRSISRTRTVSSTSCFHQLGVCASPMALAKEER